MQPQQVCDQDQVSTSFDPQTTTAGNTSGPGIAMLLFCLFILVSENHHDDFALS